MTPFVVATSKSLGIMVFQVLGSHPLEILILEVWDEAPIADFFFFFNMERFTNLCVILAQGPC